MQLQSPHKSKQIATKLDLQLIHTNYESITQKLILLCPEIQNKIKQYSVFKVYIIAELPISYQSKFNAGCNYAQNDR